MEGKQDKVELELRSLADQWLRAKVHRDETALAALLADDAIITTGAGKVMSKTEEIAYNAIYVHNVGYSITVDEVQVYEDTAIMTGIYEQTARRPDHSGRWMLAGRRSQRFTFVWVRRGSLWQIVAAQYTVVER
jgi:uncharacterized protein (TIGR02246 family)